ncbi:MAG: hypothetical protein ACXVLQ_13020 [Bacteriovorax sp.]
MKRVTLSIFLFLFSSSLWAAEPCCGPISNKALKNEDIFDGTHVEQLWLNGRHVDWQTGVPDKPSDYHGPDTHSHCSAFTAALAKKMGIYLLRPPEHVETFLASAQAAWLASTKAESLGWKKVSDMKEAQRLSNLGEFVIAVYPNPRPDKPGHIAIVRASIKSETVLEQEGPTIIQAGINNYSSTSVRNGFSHHPEAFPDKILYYVHSN